MSTTNVPSTSFPNDLDDYSTMLLVFDGSQSSIAEDLDVTGSEVSVVPDFSSPEKWSQFGGYVKIGEEDAFYSSVDVTYASSDQVGSASGIFVSQLNSGSVGSSMTVNGLSPTAGTGASSVTLRGHSYTCVGTIRVGSRDVDIAVEGNGKHGAGAVFYVSKPDLVQIDFCWVDADSGELNISTVSFGWMIKSLYWITPLSDANGDPLRRVTKLKGLLRGMRGTTSSSHPKGEVVRGNIMAEHHELLASATRAMERLVGVDDSEDRSSQDFRLRDLSDMCVEGDDFGCPEPTLDYQDVTENKADNCLVTRTVEFQASIGGDYDRFAIFFGDKTSTSESLVATHTYPSGARVEPYIYAANSRCESSSGFFEETRAQGIPELPQLVCPDILIPTIPPIPDLTLPDFEPSNTQIIIGGNSFTFPSIFVSIPTSVYFSVPPLPSISIFMPSFPTSIHVDFDPPPITVVYTLNVNFPPDSGPCFMIIPCGSGVHHPGYH